MDSTETNTKEREATHRAIYIKAINTLDWVAEALGFHENLPKNVEYLIAVNKARAAVMAVDPADGEDAYDEDHVDTKFYELKMMVYDRAEDYHVLAKKTTKHADEQKAKKAKTDDGAV